MAVSAQHSIPRDKFLLIAVNLLHRQFIKAPRTEAKRLYGDLFEGRVLPLTRVRMEDDSIVDFRLELDFTEYEGKLNFGAWRASLNILLENLSRALQQQQEVTVFGMEQRPDSVLFGITGVSVEKGQANVMVLGADVADKSGGVLLRLMYLDHRQFAQQDAAAGADPG
jgi:hypothetical protein